MGTQQPWESSELLSKHYSFIHPTQNNLNSNLWLDNFCNDMFWKIQILKKHLAKIYLTIEHLLRMNKVWIWFPTSNPHEKRREREKGKMGELGETEGNSKEKKKNFMFLIIESISVSWLNLGSLCYRTWLMSSWVSSIPASFLAAGQFFMLQVTQLISFEVVCSSVKLFTK